MDQPVLSYSEFIACLRENVEDRLEEAGDSGVTVAEIMKNNGVVFDILTIEKGEGQCTPVFYLKDLYGQYLHGKTAEDLAECVLEQYGRYADQNNIDFEWLCRLENICERIVLKAVNYERNRVQLENCPYIKELDLALTFRVLLEQKEDQLGTILVTNELMTRWEITEFDLFDLAVRNMQKLWHPTLEPIQDVLYTLMQLEDEYPDERAGDFEDLQGTWKLSMYVLSNDMRLNGATVLFYTDCLRKFADRMEKDIFVLPSSIHEVLLIPEEDEFSAWDFRQIVEQVNHQLVSEDEILSDHVYRYLYRENRLVIGA